jgi:hypothetical protein
MKEMPKHNEDNSTINEYLSTQPPFIWPEARWHTKDSEYQSKPPFDSAIADADLINGVIVGAWNGTIQWVNGLMKKEGSCKVILVLLVYPACPTREEHLLKLLEIQNQIIGDDKKLDLRLLPFDLIYEKDFERMVLPPTVLQAQDSKSGKALFCMGSTGDSGRDNAKLGSFNMVFQPEDGLRNEWRKWFQFIFSYAAPLTAETARIPHLIPAVGDPAAAEMWTAFNNKCLGPEEGELVKPKVDPETGEILEEPDGATVKPWDDNKTKLDPLAQLFQQIYANGYLVTIDETTRIKPLAIPVKAALLGQRSERSVGALTQRQSFNLKVLDELIAKRIEKCRLVYDIMDLLSYPLSKGNRWLPETAKSLLERELTLRNKKGCSLLKEALGGNEVLTFINKRRDSIRQDLDSMYQQLGQGKSVPNDKVKSVLDEIQERLTLALNARITPSAIYNQIASPDLTASAPSENWSQPLSLLLRSSRLMRKSLTDTYFPRRFKDLSFVEDDFRKAMNIFDDIIVKEPDSHRAQMELLELEKIEKGTEGPKEKCNAVRDIIFGKSNT